MDYDEMLVSIGDVKKLLYRILPKNVTTTAIENYVGYLSVADAKPVVRGEWKCVSKVYPNYGLWNKWYCSCCGYIRTVGWEYTSEGKRPNVCCCENCGADMRPCENLKAGAEYADADTMVPAT